MKYIAIFFAFLTNVVGAQTTGWKQLPGPMTGTIKTVEVSKDNTVFAVTPDGHIHIRDNNTKVWRESLPEGLITEKQYGIYTPIPYNIYLDVKGNHYLCSYMINGSVPALHHGIYRSSDNGISWQPVLKSRSVPTLREAGDGNIYAISRGDGSNTILIRSTDNGVNWNEVTTFPFTTADFVIDSKQRCYFSIQSGDKSLLVYDIRSGFYKSLTPKSSNGTSYYPPDITLVHDRPFIRFYDISYFIDDENEFSKRSIVGYQPGVAFPRTLLSSPSGSLYIFSHNGSTFNLYRSLDTGMTWLPLSTQPYDNGASSSFAIDSSESLLIGLSTGIFRTQDNGGYWNQLGLPVANVPLLQRGPQGSIYVHDSTLIQQYSSYAYTNREMISNDSGVNWYTTDLLPVGFYGRFEYDNAGGIYYFKYGFDGQFSYKYSVWYADSSAPYSFEQQSTFPNTPTSSACTKDKLYVHTGGSILFTSDKGVTWEALDIPTTTSSLSSFSISPDGTFYIGYSPSLYRSVDEGKTWIKILTPMKNTTINHILHSATSTIVSTSSQGVWRSDDNGVHWDRWDLTTRDTVRTMKIIGSRCYVGTSGGLLSCDVGSNNWKFELFVDEERPIHQIFSPDNKRVYVSVEDNGIWTNDLNLNSVYTTYPTNDNVAVSYDAAGNGKALYLRLSDRKDISLSLYNILGKKRMQIADGVYEQGESIIPFSTSSFEAGVYVLHMRSKDGLISEKIIVSH